MTRSVEIGEGSGAAPRVMQLVLSLHPGGTERLVVELVRRLHSEIPMAVCCLDAEGAWGADLRRTGISVTTLARRPGFQPSLGRDIARCAREHRADVIHCHHYSPFIYGCFARLWRRQTAVIFTEHGRLSDARPSRKRRLANACFARLPEGVFAVSDDLKQHIVDEGFAKAAVQVIYNGIDVGPLPGAEPRERVRHALGVPPEAIIVATIARLDPVKNLHSLLAAVARLAVDPHVVVLVIGDGSQMPQLLQESERLGLSNRVRFLGHRDDARDWLAGADIYVNCSISEGVSLTILEAMAAGLPVVATAVGGTPEVVTDDCGRLVPARDAEALAQAIASLCAEESVRRRLGAAGRLRVEQMFTIDRMVAEYRKVYESAA